MVPEPGALPPTLLPPMPLPGLPPGTHRTHNWSACCARRWDWWR